METIGEKRWNSWSKRNLGLERRDKLSAEIEATFLPTATRPRSFPPSFHPPLTLLPSRNLVETAADSSVRPLVSSFADVTGSLAGGRGLIREQEGPPFIRLRVGKIFLEYRKRRKAERDGRRKTASSREYQLFRKLVRKLCSLKRVNKIPILLAMQRQLQSVSKTFPSFLRNDAMRSKRDSSVARRGRPRIEKNDKLRCVRFVSSSLIVPPFSSSARIL